MKLSFNLIFVFIFTLSMVATAQKTELETVETSLTYAVYHGSVNPTKDKTEMDNNDKRKLSRRDHKINRNFAGRFPHKVVRPELEHIGPDKLRQTTIPQASSKRPPLELLVNVEGLDTGDSPQDPSGDAGLEYYVQGINATRIGIYDKEGNRETFFNADNLWTSVGVRSGGDPIILFDQEAERWIITEFPSGFGSNANKLLVAISQTSDPMGDYNIYSFTTPNFPDYPKYSVWNDSYMVTTNETGPRQLSTYFINRDDMLEGVDNVRILRSSVDGPRNSEQNFIVSTPVDWSGMTLPPAGAGPMCVSLGDASWENNQAEDLIHLDIHNVDWENETVSIERTSIEVSPYDSNPCSESGFGFQCIPQGGNGGGLDGLPEIITFQPHYRNFGSHESIVFNFITDVTDGQNLAGIRWMELRRTGGNDWALYQEGTFAPDDGLDRFMCGIAIDMNGNMGMVYNTSSPDEFVGLKMTGRLVGDELGKMTLPETTLIEGTGTLRTGGRYGDYPHMTVDPVDGSRFWFTGEYAENGTSSTRIVSFKVAKSAYDIAPVQIESPQSGIDKSNERVEVVIGNLGLNTASNYTVGYQLDNNPKVEEFISTELQENEELNHTFSTTVDLSEIRDYDLTVYTSYQIDEFVFNDTLKGVLSHLAQLDLAVTNISSPFNTVCGESSDISYTLQNLGVNDVSNAMIAISVNGEIVEDFLYEQTIPSGSEVELTTTIFNLLDGDNDISITVSQPNGSQDQIPTNNTYSETIFTNTTGTQIVLTLETDLYAYETSWALLNSQQDTVAQSDGTLEGQNNQTILELFCLDSTECYTFVILDQIGDGVTSFNGDDGYYEITDEEGNILASIITADFGSIETNDFCVDFECNLEFDIMTVDATGSNDGMALIEVTNGRGPDFLYSLDSDDFSVSNVFEGLEPGEYTVYVQDEYGCESTQTFTIGDDVAVTTIDSNRKITMFPNPTDGLFMIEITGLESDAISLPVDVYNSKGQIIQRSNVATYSGIYKGTVSLFHYPAGVYLVKVKISEEEQYMMRVARQ